MNPTKAQIKTSLGFKFDTELADFLGITKQAVSQQADAVAIPDAWCWRAFQKRPDLFDAAPAGVPAANDDQVGEAA